MILEFFPSLLRVLYPAPNRHHFMLDVYKKDLKGRKQIEETIMASHGLKAPPAGGEHGKFWGLHMALNMKWYIVEDVIICVFNIIQSCMYDICIHIKHLWHHILYADTDTHYINVFWKALIGSVCFAACYDMCFFWFCPAAGFCHQKRPVWCVTHMGLSIHIVIPRLFV